MFIRSSAKEYIYIYLCSANVKMCHLVTAILTMILTLDLMSDWSDVCNCHQLAPLSMVSLTMGHLHGSKRPTMLVIWTLLIFDI